MHTRPTLTRPALRAPSSSNSTDVAAFDEDDVTHRAVHRPGQFRMQLQLTDIRREPE